MSTPLVISLKKMGGSITRDVPCCPECKKSNVHRRIKAKTWTCESCGWSGKNPGKKPSTYVVKLPKALKERFAQKMNSEGAEA
ncbi:hypothetical protein ACSAZL_01095 [Methanosarcina sp. T3]|uniref:hypothetical protein n=1 Tax=Methanosarcina sp. T3 TaxID=3439062 RepID=UPI003F84CD72